MPRAGAVRLADDCGTGLFAWLLGRSCPEPADPTSTSTPDPGTGAPGPIGEGLGDLVGGLLPGGSAGDGTPGASESPGAAPRGPLPAAPLDDAYVFTTTPAQLSGSSISIGGLSGLAIVKVRLADGSTQRALRIEADRVVVGGFRLDVPAADGHGLRNTATTLTVEGHVVIYTPSVAGIVAGGAQKVIDTLADPTPEALQALLTVELPLYGMQADDIVYDASHQEIQE